MLIDKGELWNNIAVRVHYDPENPLRAFGNLLGEISNAPVVDSIPVEWIKQYIEKVHDNLDYARQDNDEEAMKRIWWKYEALNWLVEDWEKSLGG